MTASTAIALFAFRRPEHTRQTLASLAANPLAAGLPLLAFCDGPRSEADSDACEKTRQVIADFTSLNLVELVAHPDNQGLARNLTGGISQTLERYDRVIVIEDDLELAPNFLDYMLWGLDRFQNSPQVASIHGYAQPVAGLPDYFFLRGADCWGWATWRDRWRAYRPDAEGLIAELLERRLAWQFNLTGSAHMFRILQEAADGRLDSWAIRWHAANFLAGRLTLHPGRSFVHNHGHDGSGTHSPVSDRWTTPNLPSVWPPQAPPLREDAVARAKIWQHEARSVEGSLRLLKATFSIGRTHWRRRNDSR